MLHIDFRKATSKKTYDVPLENIKGTFLKNIVELFPTTSDTTEVKNYTDKFSSPTGFKIIYNILMNKKISLECYSCERSQHLFQYYGFGIEDIHFDAESIVQLLNATLSDEPEIELGFPIDGIENSIIGYDCVKLYTILTQTRSRNVVPHTTPSRPMERTTSIELFSKDAPITLFNLVEASVRLEDDPESVVSNIILDPETTNKKLVLRVEFSDEDLE